MKQKTKEQLREGWEDEFDRMFVYREGYDPLLGGTHLDPVKSFIRTLLQEKERELVENFGKIKQWVFTSSYALEHRTNGDIVPLKRSDDEYIKVSDLKAVIKNTFNQK